MKKWQVKKPQFSQEPGQALKDRLLEFESATTRHTQRYLLRRWDNFREVGRHALGWLLIVALLVTGVLFQIHSLSAFYTSEVPAAGGTYSEGVVGSADNFNPLFAASEPELTVSHLVFSSLFKYDINGNLTGDLADSWSVDSTGRIYTVHLRPNIQWSDGTPITANDVVYTIDTIQDPATDSPLADNWEHVQVTAVNPQTVTFTLPTTFPPFIYSLTLGIIPQHILASIPDYELRTAAFDTDPSVGSGPFAFQDSQAFSNDTEIRLIKNANYYGGAPLLNGFDVYAYNDYSTMVSAFSSGDISAASDLVPQDAIQLEKKTGVQVTESPLMNETFAFFNMDSPVLQDSRVREALADATNKTAIVNELGGFYKVMNTPLLPGQLGYDSALDVDNYNVATANTLLDQAGWIRNKNGIREKDGQPLTINLAASSDDVYPQVASALEQQWQALGIVVQTNLTDPSDMQQNVILPRSYDVLIYQLALGADPDVYAYWDSSQIGQDGLNLSNYDSQYVDYELETARTRTDPNLRAAKYEAFTQQWLSDVPAIALYQPTYGYAMRKGSSGFEPHTLIDQTDRFVNVTMWSTSTKRAIEPH
jgi:peptide/nickel transport system substrate-binding protein